MYSTAHKHHTGIEPLLIILSIKVPPCVQYDLVLYAFLLALMVNAHIAQYTEAEFSDFTTVGGEEYFLCVLLGDYAVESGNGLFAKERLYTHV